MRTLIKASWLVGHEAGHHQLFSDGVVVYEGNGDCACRQNVRWFRR